MNLKEKIQADVKEALKSGDKDKRMVLSTLMAAIKSKELTKRGQLSKTITDAGELEIASHLSDEEIIDVIASEVKKRKESIEQFRAGGREELAQKEQTEIDVLVVYLPEQMSEEHIRAEVQAVITELGATDIKDMGKVVGAIMPKLKGRAEGAVVSRIVKELLTT